MRETQGEAVSAGENVEHLFEISRKSSAAESGGGFGGRCRANDHDSKKTTQEKWSLVTKQIHGSDQLPLPRVLPGASLGRALQAPFAPLHS